MNRKAWVSILIVAAGCLLFNENAYAGFFSAAGDVFVRILSAPFDLLAWFFDSF